MKIRIGLSVAIALAVSLAAAKSNNYPDKTQCTWYAAERFNAGAPEPGVNWGGNACDWFQNAADKGWEIRTAPTSAMVGAIAVWSEGAGRLGHVAFVTYVSPDKREIRVSEKNWVKATVTEKNFPNPAALNQRVAKDGTPYRFLGYVYPKCLGKMSVRPRP